MAWLSSLILSLLAASQVQGCTPRNHRNTLVNTTKGYVEGFQSQGIRQFKGIPYAQPPVGDLRWRAPVEAKAFNSTYLTTTFGNACMQPPIIRLGPGVTVDEDCLYLNVFTPSNVTRDAKLAVGFWIYGGEYRMGDGSQWDPHEIVRDSNIVLVTINYRVGPWGFFHIPGLNDADHPTANFAIGDQQMAMQWVQDNIVEFGGDPSRVTAFGYSAGGASVCYNLVSPSADNLFQQGISQSYPCSTPEIPSDLEDFEKASPAVLTKHLGCSDAADAPACMRSKSSDDILAAVAATGTIFTVSYAPNERYIQRSPRESFLSGQYKKRPLMGGVTAHENRLGWLSNWRVINETDYDNLIASFGNVSSLVAEQYPISINRTYPAVPMADLMTARQMVCTQLGTHNTLVKTDVPTWFYEFSDENAPALYSRSVEMDYGKAYHAAELPYLFDCSDHNALSDNSQRDLAQAMRAYWTSFMITGDPNTLAAGKKFGNLAVPRWKKYTGDDMVLSLNTAQAGGIQPINLNKEHKCDFWNGLFDFISA